MIIAQPGKITNSITMLGRHEACVYLVQGPEQSVLLGGGMAHIVPDLLRQLEEFKVDEQKITHIVVLHAHFDHCGAVPFLKKRWPRAKVTASRRAAELLAKPQVMEGIARMNNGVLESLGLTQAAVEGGFLFDSLQVEVTVGETDRVPCGPIALDVLEVPGHSSCSIAVHMPSEKALFASDALGLYRDGVHQPTPNSNYDQYQQSLERLAPYAPEVILLEHFGAVTGEEARGFIPKAIATARETRELLETTYRRTRDVDQCTREIIALFLQRPADAFLPEAVRATVASQMVRFIARRVEEQMKENR